jgi:hypothetical protein
MPVIATVKYGALTPVSDSQELYLHATWTADNASIGTTGVVTADAGTDLITADADHELVEDEIVRFTTTGTLPAGLSLATNYYVIAAGLTNDDFKVSATLGGGAVNITDAGTGTHTCHRYETAATQWEIETTQDGVVWDPAAFVLSLEAFIPELIVTPDLAFRIRASAPGTGRWMVPYTVEFPVIVGPDTIDCTLGARPMARMVRTNSALAADGLWTITGAPPGVGIYNNDEPLTGLLGGSFSGAPSADGEYNAVITWQAEINEGNEWFDQRQVLFRVNGTTYLADFHEDRSRTGVIVDTNTRVVGGWQFVNGALPVEMGDAFTLHAILRDGAAFIDAGVTDLELVCKLQDQRDAPHTWRFSDPAPTVDTFGTVNAWPLDVEFKGQMLEQIFAVLNAPGTAAESSREVLLDAQLSWTHSTRRRVSRVFGITVRQPLILR